MKQPDGCSLRYRLTEHAKKIIVERGISNSWIDRVLTHPLMTERDKEDPTLHYAFGRVPECGDKILRVYNETVKPWAVVTAFFDRKASRLL